MNSIGKPLNSMGKPTKAIGKHLKSRGNPLKSRGKLMKSKSTRRHRKKDGFEQVRSVTPTTQPTEKGARGKEGSRHRSMGMHGYWEEHDRGGMREGKTKLWSLQECELEH